MATQPNALASNPPLPLPLPLPLTLMLYPTWVMGRTDIVKEIDADGARILRIKICRTCQSSLKHCVCGNPVSGDQPLPIIWRAGQGENTRLMKYLSTKKPKQTDQPILIEAKSPAPESSLPAETRAPVTTPASMREGIKIPPADPLPTVPAIFKSCANWVTYKDATKVGKIPRVSGSERYADTSDPTTWVSYQVACQNIQDGKGYANLGFVTDGANSNNLTGIDLDGCRNHASGDITAWAQNILNLLGATYVEITPSGDGLRAWVIGVIPPDENVFKLALTAGFGNKVQIEVYTDRKYFCMTGKPHANAPSVVLPLVDVEGLLSLLRSTSAQYPVENAPTATKEKKSKRAVPVENPDGSVKFVPAEPDPGFKALFDAVGWDPLVRRMDAMHDTRFHGLSLDTSKLIYCPMPGHGTRSESLPYTKCFGTIRENPAVVNCFGCKWSNDLVSTIREFDAGEDGGHKEYKNNYEVARVICAEEGLNFEDYFPTKPATTTIQATTNELVTTTPAVLNAVPIYTDEEAQRYFADCEMFEGVLVSFFVKGSASVSGVKEVGGGKRAVKITSASNYTPVPVEWVWRFRIVKGNLTVFSGDPDKGKTLVYIDAAARITRGLDFFDSPNTLGGTKDVMILASEDDIENTLVPRLIVAGADMDRVHFICMTVNVGGTEEESLVCLDTDLKEVEESLQRYPETALVVFDPLDAFLGEMELTKPKEMRTLMSALKAAAKRLQVGFLSIVHWNKNSEAASVNRTGGARAVVAAPRVAWLFQTDPDEPTMHLMLKGKGNLMRSDTKGLSFNTVGVPYTFPNGVTDEVPKIKWIGETDAQSDDLLIQERDPKQRKGAQAERIIVEKCSDQPALASEIYDEGKRAGVSAEAMRDARIQLKYVCKQLRDDILQSDLRVSYRWYWAKDNEQLEDFKSTLQRLLEEHYSKSGGSVPSGRGRGSGSGKIIGSESPGSGGKREGAGRKSEKDPD